MSASAFFHAPCPSCGAPVELASSASVFAVCGYCQSGLGLSGDKLEKLGKVSEVLEDYSPLQLGASGRWKNRGFTLIGRIQLRYPGGFWNEWYLGFEDGTNGWMSDASGQYAMLERRPMPNRAPAYNDLAPGIELPLLGDTFFVTDRRQAKCLGGQGELPFPLSESWTASVVDLLSERQMATLDYSDAEPVLYLGEPVQLQQMHMQLLRSPDEIREKAGRIPSRLHAFQCPSCGHTLTELSGQTPQVTCPACRSVLDTASPVVKRIEAGRTAGRSLPKTVLRLGDMGTLFGVSWRVLGVVMKSADFEGERFGWEEYLLFSPAGGLRWLTWSSEAGWLFSEQLQRPPRMPEDDLVMYSSNKYRLAEDYESRVDSAWGSFNWEVRAGDTAHVFEYEGPRLAAAPGPSRLVLELTDSEMVWSHCQPLSSNAVMSAFGKKATDAPKVTLPTDEGPVSAEAARTACGWMLAAQCFFMFTSPTLAGLLLGLLSGLVYLYLFLKTAE